MLSMIFRASSTDSLFFSSNRFNVFFNFSLDLSNTSELTSTSKGLIIKEENGQRTVIAGDADLDIEVEDTF